MKYKTKLIILWFCAVALIILVFAALRRSTEATERNVINQEAIEEVSEESSVAEIVPTITEEYIAEVMMCERPHVEEVKEETPIRYPLTDEERTEIERVVMAEAGGECREGIIAVAQCILNASEKEDVRPTEAIKMYKYTPIRKEPNEAVKEAVTAVFDNGETVTEETILFFYANYIYSGWHESQRFVTQIGVHRFFALND